MTHPPLLLEALRLQVAYSRWASERLVAEAAKLTPEELTRDFGTADKSVLGTLVHVYAADRVWMGRITGHPPAKFIDPEKDMHLATLQQDWPGIADWWKTWIGSHTEETLRQQVHYKDLKGNEYHTPYWQVTLHVVNHATHHRGQVSGFLRALGKTPPPVDLIAYYRSLTAL
jgi:uncharacterized damage-inducible protein DinB